MGRGKICISIDRIAVVVTMSAGPWMLWYIDGIGSNLLGFSGYIAMTGPLGSGTLKVDVIKIIFLGIVGFWLWLLVFVSLHAILHIHLNYKIQNIIIHQLHSPKSTSPELSSHNYSVTPVITSFTIDNQHRIRYWQVPTTCLEVFVSTAIEDLWWFFVPPPLFVTFWSFTHHFGQHCIMMNTLCWNQYYPSDLLTPVFHFSLYDLCF